MKKSSNRTPLVAIVAAIVAAGLLFASRRCASSTDVSIVEWDKGRSSPPRSPAGTNEQESRRKFQPSAVRPEILMEEISTEQARRVYQQAGRNRYGNGGPAGVKRILEQRDYVRNSRSRVETLMLRVEDGFVYSRHDTRFYREGALGTHYVALVNREGRWRLKNDTATLQPSIFSPGAAKAVAAAVLAEEEPVATEAFEYTGDRGSLGGRSVYVVRQILPDTSLADQARTGSQFNEAIASLLEQQTGSRPTLSAAPSPLPKVREFMVDASSGAVLMERRYGADGQLLHESLVLEQDNDPHLSAADFDLPVGITISRSTLLGP